ncbi:MAG TPA: tyrosine-type recombinase/integrase [Dehalococcoidia bacterium]|nr:tyrosine-type recombinase/integrase [Dehalococcoidia bacterium]
MTTLAPLELAYTAWLEARDLRPASIAHDLKCLRAWRRHCDAADVDLLQAQIDDVLAFMAALRTAHGSGTLRAYVKGVRLFYDFARERGLAQLNPAASVKPPRRVQRPTEPFSEEEIRAFLDGCETARDRAMLLLLLGGGLRRSELIGIRREDVNREAATIAIHGKGGKQRLIAPGAAVLAAVAAAEAEASGDYVLMPLAAGVSRAAASGRFVPGCSGNSTGRRQEDTRPLKSDFVYRRIVYLAQKAGIRGRVNPHRWRHTFAVRFCEAGGGIDQLQVCLGHASVEQSMHYARIGQERRALKAMAALSPLVLAGAEGARS